MSLILVVDDDDFNRETIREALIEEGFEVATAPDGKAALEQIEERSPDLILLDVYMSVMDGPEFLEEYRRRPGPRAPVVVVTAREAAEEHAKHLAVAGFLGKPFDLQELSEAVHRHLGRSGEH